MRKPTLTDVPAAIDRLDKEDPDIVKHASDTLMRYAHRLANTDQREPLAKLLCEHLAARDKHKTATRVTLCRVLGFVGDKESATPLYKAMNELNPPLQEMARWALVRNPSRHATNALIGGLQTASDDLLVGVINGLGERGDVRVVPTLVNHVNNPHPPAARAALDALARLPHPLSIKTVQLAVQEKKPGALDALLELADNLIDHEMRSEAHRALLPLVDRKDLTAAQQCRWLHGLGRIGGDIPTQFVMRALDNDNARIRGAALEACALLPGSDASTTIARKAQAAGGPLKLNLIELLGRRGDRMSDDTADFLTQSISDEDPAVRVAAENALKRLKKKQ